MLLEVFTLLIDKIKIRVLFFLTFEKEKYYQRSNCRFHMEDKMNYVLNKESALKRLILCRFLVLFQSTN